MRQSFESLKSNLVFMVQLIQFDLVLRKEAVFILSIDSPCYSVQYTRYLHGSIWIEEVWTCPSISIISSSSGQITLRTENLILLMRLIIHALNEFSVKLSSSDWCCWAYLFALRS